MRMSMSGLRFRWTWSGVLVHGLGFLQTLVEGALLAVAALFMCAVLSGGNCPCGGAGDVEQGDAVNRAATVRDGADGGRLTQTSATPRRQLTDPRGESPNSDASTPAARVADPAMEARGESPPVLPESGRSRDRPE